MKRNIEYRICRENLGDSSDAHVERYIVELNSALVAEFPDAAITVNLDSQFANEPQTLVSEDRQDGLREAVEEIAERVWVRLC